MLCRCAPAPQLHSGHQAVSVLMLSSSTNIFDFTLSFLVSSVVWSLLSVQLVCSPFSLKSVGRSTDSLIIYWILYFWNMGQDTELGHGPPFSGSLCDNVRVFGWDWVIGPVWFYSNKARSLQKPTYPAWRDTKCWISDRFTWWLHNTGVSRSPSYMRQWFVVIFQYSRSKIPV